MPGTSLEFLFGIAVDDTNATHIFRAVMGLYLAMVDQLLGSLEDDLAELGKQHQLTAADFSRSYARVLQANPWWPNFMVREVLFGESETRDAMVQRFASSFAPQLIASISGEIEAGRYRENLNPAMVMISLMGMTVFPFLAKPMIESVFQMQLNERFVETLADHNVALFHHGVLSESGSVAATKKQTQQGSGAAGE